MVAVPSLAGNIGSAAGSITDHPAGGPSSARTNLSTTDPRLRTRTSMVASPPGSTATSVGDRTATTATRPAVDAGPAAAGRDDRRGPRAAGRSNPSQSRNAPHGPGCFGEVGLAQNVVPGAFWKPHSGQTSIAGRLRAGLGGQSPPSVYISSASLGSSFTKMAQPAARVTAATPIR